MLKDKNIVLCVTGGIACYKAVNLCSLLKKNGANVYVVMTKNAQKFVSPITFKSITQNRVTTKMFDEDDFVPHITLSQLASVVMVAPATANIIAKASYGIADDVVSSLLVASSNKPKFIIPAMNSNMYINPIVQENIKRLQNFGYNVMTPDSGILACGTSGIGRFPNEERIVGYLLANLSDKNSYFYNKKILVTLGGTIEDIDPVRCITNRSSGKMGFAFASEFIKRGAAVSIIAGNVDNYELHKFTKVNGDQNITFIRSALALKNEVYRQMNHNDILFMASAVADYSPTYSNDKIKKVNDKIVLELKKTDDILKGLDKDKNKIYIGFAAESSDLLQNAKDKLINKGLDFLIANEVVGDKSSIANDKAEVYLINKLGNDVKKIDYSHKKDVSKQILNIIEEKMLTKIVI